MKIILTNIITPKSDIKTQLLVDVGIVIDKEKIIEIGPSYKILNKYGTVKREVTIIDRSKQICMPSFFDMHFHWVQDDVRLMPKDSLLEWLSKYTWPYEAKFKSKSYSEKKAKQFASELLQVGTLGGACYASIHPHSVEDGLKYFVGDFILGNVLMTMNSPRYLTQSNKSAIHSVCNLAKKFGNRYAVTPRFAPTTSPEVMKKSAQIGKRYKSFIQTHLSETPSEIDYVLSIYKKIKNFENVKNYTEIYFKANILSSKTIMGHGIYLGDDELKMLSKTKTKICHCPTSNAPVKNLGLGSGLFDFRKTEKFKIDWALGSDIGGGPYLSMFDVMNSFVEQNKAKKIKEATFQKALYRATLAGAKMLGLEKKTGSIEKGKYANLIFVDAPRVILKKMKDQSIGPEVILEKIISGQKKKRENYDTLVLETMYRGNVVFTKL